MTIYTQPDPLSDVEDSLKGTPIPELGVGSRRRDGWLSALLNSYIQPDAAPSNGPGAQRNSILQAMDNDPSQDRIADDTTRHPQGQDTSDLSAATSSRRPSLRLRDAMAASFGSASPTPSTPLTDAEAALAKAQKPSGVSGLMTKARGIHNPILRGLSEVGAGLARGLDVTGSIVAPNYTAMIPGSTLNREVRIRGAQGRLNQAMSNAEREAQIHRLEDEPPQHMESPEGPIEYNPQSRRWEPIVVDDKPLGSALEATATGRRQLAQKYGLQGEDAVRYVLTGQMPVAADKPNLSEQIGQRAQIADQYGLQGADRQRYILTGQLPADKPDTAAQEDARMETLKARQLRGEELSPRETSDLQAYSWRKTLGPQATAGAADTRQTKQQQFEIDKEARGQVNAAEKRYRQAKESADALGDFINLASQGNKIAGAAVPLEGTLEIVTSQGVKRINRTEVEGIEGAGSLFDRIQSKIGKWTKGQPMPADLLQDFKTLNDTMRQNSYRAYSDAYDQARDTYSAYGTDFGKIKKLPVPLKDQMSQQNGGPAAGMVRFQDSQGGIHDIPRGNLGKARRRDPGLTVLGQ